MIRTGELNVDGSTNTTKFWLKPGFTRAPPPQPKEPRVVVTPTEDEFDIVRTALRSEPPGIRDTAGCIRVDKVPNAIAGDDDAGTHGSRLLVAVVSLDYLSIDPTALLTR